MGGKGGGGGGGGGSQYATGHITKAPWNPTGWSDEYTKAEADAMWAQDHSDSNRFRQEMLGNRRNYLTDTGTYDDKAWRAAKGGAGLPWAANLFDRWFPEPAAAPAAAAAPPPAAPAPEAPAPAAPAAPEAPPVNPIDPGGAIDQPDTTGSQLGGAVLNPPQYWIGNTDQYNKAGTKGSMTTTQT